jgi:nitrate/nitrite transporter NarK
MANRVMLTRNRVLILMCVSMVLGYMPWYNFSALSKFITDDFGLTAGDMGVILSAFQVGYVVTVVATGWLTG